MYAILICFVFTSFIFIIFGHSFIKLLDKNKNYSLFDSYFIGLCLVGTFLNFWSLFFPTNFVSFILLLTICFFLSYKKKINYRVYFFELVCKVKEKKFFLFIGFLSLVVVLFFSVVTPKLFDSYLYHINAIQWNEKYRVVPGLANLHDRFGFNSSVFVLSAGFTFNFVYDQYLFIINSLSYLFFFIWCLKLALSLNNFKSIFLLLFIYYFTNQYYLDISSPGSDLLSNIFLSYLLINICLFENVLIKKKLVYIVLPLFCITLKLSTVPIILIAITTIYIQKNTSHLRKIMTFTNLSILFVLPWIVRNVIISGYLLFPMSSIDIFNFDWKVPVENVNITRDWVYSWAKIPFKDYHEVLNLEFGDWFKVWWNNALPLNKKFYILCFISIFIYLFFILFWKKRDNKIISIFVALLIILLWFFKAPEIRFAFSVILFLALSPILLLNLPEKFKNKINSNSIVKLFTFITLVLILNMAYGLFKKDFSLENLNDYYYLPKDVSYVKEQRKIKYNKIKSTNNIHLYEPEIRHMQCFDKFPCSPFIEESIEFRGKNLKDGFLNTKTVY